MGVNSSKNKRLINAIKGANIPQIQAALDEGADVNCRDAFVNWTALAWACFLKKEKVFMYLVDRGASVHKPINSDLDTPLMWACCQYRLEWVKFFYYHGANVHTRNRLGKTALMYAVSAGFLEMVQFLVEEANAHINEWDNQGETPLIFASFTRKLDIVIYLVSRGADVEHRNKQGEDAVAKGSWDTPNAIAKGRRLLGAQGTNDTISIEAVSPEEKELRAALRTQDPVYAFLRAVGVESFYPVFRREEIDMDVLSHITDDALKEIHIPLGPRRKILRALDTVQSAVSQIRDAVSGTEHGDGKAHDMLGTDSHRQTVEGLLAGPPELYEVLSAWLKADMRRSDEKFMCMLCVSNRKSIMFEPCNHMVTCDAHQCQFSLKKCPVCRTIVLKRTKVYL